MNSITFYFSQPVPFVLAAMVTATLLLYAALNVSRHARLLQACRLGWAGFAAMVVCMVAWFKGQAYGLDAAPKPVQWQLGLALASGALLARVTLLRANELAQTQGLELARLERFVRWQLGVAAVLLGGAALLRWLASAFPFAGHACCP